MTKFEIEALERHLHLLDDMRLRAHRLASGSEGERNPGTALERAQALDVAHKAVSEQLEAAKRAAAAKTCAAA